jgi:hypothetical protein
LTVKRLCYGLPLLLVLVLVIRQSTTVGVEYGSEVETVKAILADAAKENPWVISDNP